MWEMSPSFIFSGSLCVCVCVCLPDGSSWLRIVWQESPREVGWSHAVCFFRSSFSSPPASLLPPPSSPSLIKS